MTHRTPGNRTHSARRRTARRLLPLFCVVVLLLTQCTLPPTVETPTPVEPFETPTETVPTPATGSAVGSTTPDQEEKDMPSTPWQLTEGREGAATPEPAPTDAPTAGEALAAADVQRVLARLPNLEEVVGDRQVFRLPVKSLPAPRPGETITRTFPSEEDLAAPDEAATGPLHVLRHSPEGDVDLAPFLSITFDQPMVALTSHADLATLQVPVELDPLPEGEWRWVGTKTLVFQPLGRFPMATEYTARVAAGTTSATEGRLEEAFEWTFTTPPPNMIVAFPQNGPHVRQPLMVVAFDQRIDPLAAHEMITVRASGSTYPTHLATEAEIDADANARRVIDRAGEGRWVAFRPDVELPYDTTVVVSVGAGTPSAEGPRVTAEAQSYSFTTYGPMTVVESRCGWGDECAPMSPWVIRFSNPLDEDLFDEGLVTVEPELPGMSVSPMGNAIRIQGRSQGRTKYTVTLSDELTDVFGQPLTGQRTVTFNVGSAPATMSMAPQSLVVLDPKGPRTYSVFTINYDVLRVRAYAVEPEDWPAYMQYLVDVRREKDTQPPGTQVLDKRVRPGGQADALVETAIDLNDALDGEHGHLILVVEPESGLLGALRRRQNPVLRVWVQASDIAADAFVDSKELLVWTSSLVDGSPLAKAEVTVYPGGKRASADEQGLARFGVPADSRGVGYLVARVGDDVAVLPESAYPWSNRGWQVQSLEDEYRWYVFDDRGMYRPGEEVHLKGWVRHANVSREGDTLSLPAASTKLRYQLTDARGNLLLEDNLTLSALGGFDTALTLPEEMNLGMARFELSLLGGPGGTRRDHTHTFQVQEFRRPEFEVSASASEGPHFAQGSAELTVEAAYYAGGTLPNAEVRWDVHSTKGSYRPPDWSDFEFGISRPWWWFARLEDEGQTHSETYEGVTDAAGVHHLGIEFKTWDPPQPTSITAEATVMDVNRQAWTASTVLLVHPAADYVGLRTERMFVERGEPMNVDAIVTDLDGKPIAGREIIVRAVRVSYEWKKGDWIEKETDEQTYTVISTEEPVRCVLSTENGGRYRISATIEDEQGRANLTEITRWVSGGQRPTLNRVEKEEATLIPDRDEYQPGDTAEILVQSPFVPAEGLLTVRRNGLVVTERFTMDGPSTKLTVEIDESHIPDIHVQVDLVGQAARLDAEGEADLSLPPRPAYASGTLRLPVPPLARILSVEAEPRETELEPGGQTVVDVRVADAAGAPVANAEVAVVVVDEAVLALTDYQWLNPVYFFHPSRSPGVSDYYLRQYVLLVDPDRLLEEGAMQEVEEAAVRSFSLRTSATEDGMAMKEAPMLAAMAPAPTPGAGESGGEPIRMRLDFNPLATFAPLVTTDADGTASVEIALPDNLTRYRVMAVAVSEARYYGNDESSLTARLPLMVRPSPPRFLNFGDRFELPIVLQNQTDDPMTVDVAVRATNVTLTDGAGRRVTVPARNRVEVRLPVAAAEAGTARFQVGAASGRWADAAAFDLPVYTPATTEAFAVYGTVDEGAIAQPVIAPSEVYTQFGGLEISTSSTALQALTDALLYLTEYRYECSEQLASRVLAVAALRDVLSAFETEGLQSDTELDAAVARDLAKLQGMQNHDGGFPVWQRGKDSWPYHSVHVVHALARAQEKDYAIPNGMIEAALPYLREIERHYPVWYSEKVRHTISAYALYVRGQVGDVDVAKAVKLVRDVGVENLSFEALGWLLHLLSDEPASVDVAESIRLYLANHVTETAGAANYTTSYREEDGYLLLASNRRADGIILETLIADDPESDLIPKLVKGLLAHRKRGRWRNTQENVFILLALDSYFNAYEAETPDFVARAWLGDQYVAEFAFEGRTTEYQAVTVPMAYLAEGDGTQNLVLAKEGAGRMYYRLGLSYAPTDLDLAPMDRGFTIERSYEAVDDPADVTRDADGTWRVKAGTRVRVRLTMVAPSRRYHVALEDPMPAGFESLNPALAVTGSIPQDPQASTNMPRYWWWHWTWYEHQNLRDERTEAFASLLWEGVHTYTYVARATTPGRFIAPPTRAEEMYSPEVFGRGASDWVIVE